MPREQAVNIQNDFTQGLITETTPLRFPENACTDADNVVFDETARSCVRPGIDVEDNEVSQTLASDPTNDYYNSYLWENVAGTGTTSFYVQQIGGTIFFYNASADDSVSADKKSFTVDMATYKTDSAFNVDQVRCEFSDVNGDLIIVSPFTNPLSIKYLVGTDTITVTEQKLKIRDFKGIAESLTLNERPSSTYANLQTAQPLHYYNLLNQGWFDEVLNQWDTARGDMPSNADYVALSRASLTDSFDDAVLTSQEPPTTQAPRGKFILELGENDREQAITDGGFTSATLSGGSVSTLIGDMDTFTTIGNFTNSVNAFDGITSQSAAAASMARSTIDNSGDMDVGVDYTLGTTSQMSNTSRLTDGLLTSTSDNSGALPTIQFNISPSTDIVQAIIREDSGNGLTDEWFVYNSSPNDPRVTVGTELSNVAVQDQIIPLSEAESRADMVIAFEDSTVDELNFEFKRGTSGLTGSGLLKIAEIELLKRPTATTTQYIGKDFTASGKQVTSAKIWPSSDEGIHNQAIDIGWTAKLYASNSAPANSTDGTLLGTSTDGQNTTGSITINSSDSTTFYRYVWVNVQLDDVDFVPDDTQDYIYIAELQIFEVSTVAGEEGENTKERPSCVTSMNSRLFYGGINTRALSNVIYFTQILDSEANYANCYQNNDPTSENLSTLLPSDGGEIKINDMGKLYKLMSYEGSLLAFASNGVWRIWNQQGGFDATQFRIDRISDIGSTSPHSFIEVDGIPHWWGEEGIYRIEYNPQFRSFNVANISDERVRTYFLTIPSANRNFVKGVYDITEKRCIWLYSSAASFGTVNKHWADRALCYNVLTKAFYPWSFSSDGTIKIKDVNYFRTSERQNQSKVKFCVSTVEGATYKTWYADLKEDGTTFTDWYELASLIGDTTKRHAYDAFITTGYRIKGQLQRFHQPNYVYMYMEKHATAENSALLQTYHDFANDGLSNKWSVTQQLYNSNMDYRSVNFRKLKVRGKGRAIQFKIKNVPGNFFCVIGWAVKDVGNADL